MKITPPDMLCFALYSAAHAMQQAYTPLLEPLGLTYPQYLAMTALWGEDEQTVGALGKVLHLESNTLTPLIKRLEAQGLVERVRDAEDERRVLVRLTDKGRAMQSQAAHVPACILEATGLDVPEAIDLRKRVTVLRDRVKAS